MSTASCLYDGVLLHRRAEPRREFKHRVVMAYIDVAELPTLLDGRLLRRAPGALRWRRRDYHGDPDRSVDTAVRDTVGLRTGRRPAGPIRMLVALRSFGHCFNPVSFYYCFDADGERLEAVLAEVTNTPWGERHAYVAPGGVGSFAKELHVSPFMGMDQQYRCQAPAPGRHLTVAIENSQRGEVAFEASLALTREELTPASARRLSRRYPLASVRVLALIYSHAVMLRLAGVKVHQKPGNGIV